MLFVETWNLQLNFTDPFVNSQFVIIGIVIVYTKINVIPTVDLSLFTIFCFFFINSFFKLELFLNQNKKLET